MRLLICTQAVDLDDPVLGFFHRWIAELAKRCETVHVICLKEGRHQLPPNVFVHSLGKENARSRLKYISRFYRDICEYRGQYDAVFVHMNPEYAVLGGFLWRLWGKRVGLWYVHKKTPFALRAAIPFLNVVFTASRGNFGLRTAKLRVLGHGIDTEFFSPAGESKPGSILFLGRLDTVKRVDVFVRALELLHEKNVAFSADIVGDPTDRDSKYAHDVRNLAAPLCLEEILTMKKAVTNDEARDLYRSHAVYCNLTPSGSFDKTILEAMACGCLCVVANDALASVLPEKLFVKDAAGASNALQTAIEMPENERRAIADTARAFVQREHSLPRMIGSIIDILSV